MKTRIVTLSAALVLSFFVRPELVASDSSAAGHWEGAIELPGTQLKIRVDLVEPTEDGTDPWTGTIDIPMQGIRDFDLASIGVEENLISFAMPNIPGDPIFDGALDETGETLSGTFRQGGQSFPFSLERAERTEIAGQTPSKGKPGEGLVGVWQGSIKMPSIELRLLLRIHVAEDGTLSGTVDSLDQAVTGIPVSSVVFEETAVHLKLDRIGAGFSGKMSHDGSEIDGKWSQGGNAIPLVFKRLEKEPDLARPQDPRKPYPYDEREVTFENASAGITLAGTLTIPRGEGPFPAVVLATGSGPQNRDEELLGHRPFLVLADHLTRAGIAVLRFDDRGVGKSGGSHGKSTHRDFAVDVRAAFEFLKTQDKVDPERVGLCGHSEGGVHAPIVAAGDDSVAFIVMLAGVGVPLDELLRRQRDDIIRAMGAGLAVNPKEVEISNRIFDIIRNEGATDEAREKVGALLAESLSLYTPEQLNALGMSEGMVRQQTKMMFTPWFVELIRYNPSPTLSRVKCPVLAINGDKDLQVAADENLDGIRAGLAAGGNEDVTIVKLPGLNHLFQKCETGLMSEYGAIEETFNPVALETVSDWILQHFGDSP